MLPYQLLGVTPENSGELGGDASLVFVAGNPNLPGHFADSLGNIVDCMHRLHILLKDRHLQVLGDVGFRLAVSQLQPLTCFATETISGVNLHFSALACGVSVGVLNDGVGDVLRNLGLEKTVEFSAFRFIFIFLLQNQRLVVLHEAVLQLPNEGFE